MADYPPVTDMVTRARNDDRQAWNEIVERYAPLIWSICRKYRLGDADAEEVGQVVWLHLVDHLDDLRDPAALPGWIATTTRRQCIRVRRTATQLPQVTGPCLVSALWALPARQREILVLQYVADLSENQVAAAAGISEAAVRSQVALAFSALRTELPPLS